MRLLFLTGSLEPGRDGVGDYTRLLAGECARQGHEVSLIAVQDPHVASIQEGVETLAHQTVPVLRLAANIPWARRIESVEAFRIRQAPDWISLQFVAYAFDAKGFASRFTAQLKEMVAGTRLHVMLHELWIGTGPFASLRYRMIGKLQRFQLRRMLRELAPQLVTVTNPFYGSLLWKLGAEATELPLFGNIPVAPVQEPTVPDFSLGLFFGTLHSEWEPEPFMRLWLSACATKGRQPRLFSLGRLGEVGEGVWRKLQTDYAGWVDFVALGEVPSAVVSSWLQRADFGLAASPWHLIGKSGSAIAMLEHGLPVIVTRDEFGPPAGLGNAPDPLLHRCDDQLQGKLVTGLPRRAPFSRLPGITSNFIRLLKEAS